MHRIILWFRNDLRMHDNYILKTAFNSVRRAPEKTEIVPVFCFDPRFYDKSTKFGTKKCGFNRTRFQMESVKNLRESLESIGSGLVVTHDKPEEFIPKLCGSGQNTLIYQEEVCS
jgi:deoxyribodipyrimidine photo-lyase